VLQKPKEELNSGICISSITLAELEYGMKHSSDPVKNEQVLLRFLAPLNILPFGAVAATEYGAIRAHLQKQGTPIRENRRKGSIVGRIVDDAPAAGSNGRDRPKVDREIKKRVSLSVLPSLYADIQKIAYVQRRSISDVVDDLMEQFRAQHEKELAEYRKIKNSEKKG